MTPQFVIGAVTGGAIAYAKSSWIFARADLPVGQEKVRLSYGLLRWWRMRRKRGKQDGS